MPANLENSAVATGLERSVFIPIPKKGNAKECSRAGAARERQLPSGPGRVQTPSPRAMKKKKKKECSNYRTIALISHTSKVMLRILQDRLQQYVNRELPDFQLVLGKAEESEINLPTSAGSLKKQESSRKTSISALLTLPKSLAVWITIISGKF